LTRDKGYMFWFPPTASLATLAQDPHWLDPKPQCLVAATRHKASRLPPPLIVRDRSLVAAATVRSSPDSSL
jgi:hypothetical protein